MKAKCFTEDQKRLMIERVRANETGIQNKKYKRYQVMEALTDPLIWCYCLLQLTTNMIFSGLGTFGGALIKGFGLSVLDTQLLNITQGVVTMIVMVGGAWLAQKSGQTCVVRQVSYYLVCLHHSFRRSTD